MTDKNKKKEVEKPQPKTKLPKPPTPRGTIAIYNPKSGWRVVPKFQGGPVPRMPTEAVKEFQKPVDIQKEKGIKQAEEAIKKKLEKEARTFKGTILEYAKKYGSRVSPETLARAGIGVKTQGRPAGEVLKEIREKVKKLTPEQEIAVISARRLPPKPKYRDLNKRLQELEFQKQYATEKGIRQIQAEQETINKQLQSRRDVVYNPILSKSYPIPKTPSERVSALYSRATTEAQIQRLRDDTRKSKQVFMVDPDRDRLVVDPVLAKERVKEIGKIIKTEPKKIITSFPKEISKDIFIAAGLGSQQEMFALRELAKRGETQYAYETLYPKRVQQAAISTGLYGAYTFIPKKATGLVYSGILGLSGAQTLQEPSIQTISQTAYISIPATYKIVKSVGKVGVKVAKPIIEINRQMIKSKKAESAFLTGGRFKSKRKGRRQVLQTVSETESRWIDVSEVQQSPQQLLSLKRFKQKKIIKGKLKEAKLGEQWKNQIRDTETFDPWGAKNQWQIEMFRKPKQIQKKVIKPVLEAPKQKTQVNLIQLVREKQELAQLKKSLRKLRQEQGVEQIYQQIPDQASVQSLGLLSSLALSQLQLPAQIYAVDQLSGLQLLQAQKQDQLSDILQIQDKDQLQDKLQRLVQLSKPSQKQVKQQKIIQPQSISETLQGNKQQKIIKPIKQKPTKKVDEIEIDRPFKVTQPKPPKKITSKLIKISKLPIKTKKKISKRDRKKIDDYKQAYHAYVKKTLQKTSKGKYKSRGYTRVPSEKLDKKSATGLMMSKVAKFVNRTGYIKKTSGKGKTKTDLVNKFNKLKNQFRPSKKNKNLYVEKSAYAIDSREEVMGIPYKAKRVKRKKKK